jgi:hypothetical protein
MNITSAILEIYKSDWQEALADGAYYSVNLLQPTYLDKHEKVRDRKGFTKLIEKLSKFDKTRDWEDPMAQLAGRAGLNYITERATGKNFAAGGPLTLYGHTGHIFIEWGFLGSIAYSVDDGQTEKLFNKYVSVDAKIQQALNNGPDSAINYRALAEEWRLAQNAVDEAYEKLCTLLGIATE